MATIELTNGLVAVVDDDDRHHLSRRLPRGAAHTLRDRRAPHGPGGVGTVSTNELSDEIDRLRVELAATRQATNTAYLESTGRVLALQIFADIIKRFIDRGSDVYFNARPARLTIDGTVDITPDEYCALLALIGGDV